MHKTPPGPPNLLFGLNQVAMFQPSRIMQTFEACAATYGDVVRINLAGMQQTMVFHPDHVRQILIEQPEKIARSKLQQRLLGLFHGNSLNNSDGVFWQRQRKLMQPAFHTRRIQGYVDTMALETSRMVDGWREGATYNVSDEIRALTLRIAEETMFGTNTVDAVHRIEWAISTMDHFTMRKAPAMLPLPIWVPIPYHRQAQRAVMELRTLVMDAIETRRASGEDRGDLLSMLLLALDEDNGGQMTALQARDEVISLMIVGHTTTSSALTWVLAEIAQHPDVEAKIVAELDEVLGGRAPTMGDIKGLKYLDMVIRETLRMHPPSWAMPRDVVEDIELDGYLIPKGTGLLFSEQVMHHDARWFPEPQRFLPERFAEGWEKKIPKCAYMPFGMGAHNCIGQIFASVEMHVVLAVMMQRYRMALPPGHVVVTEALIDQRPRGGLPMTIERRQPALAV